MNFYNFKNRKKRIQAYFFFFFCLKLRIHIYFFFWNTAFIELNFKNYKDKRELDILLKTNYRLKWKMRSNIDKSSYEVDIEFKTKFEYVEKATTKSLRDQKVQSRLLRFFIWWYSSLIRNKPVSKLKQRLSREFERVFPLIEGGIVVKDSPCLGGWWNPYQGRWIHI